MNKYTIVAKTRLAAGVLELTETQAKTRLHNLKLLDRRTVGEIVLGRYEIVSPVEFKIGEIIGYEGDIPKVMADSMVDEAAEKKAAAAKIKAEKEAIAKAKEKTEIEAKAEWEKDPKVRGLFATFADYCAKKLKEAGL